MLRRTYGFMLEYDNEGEFWKLSQSDAEDEIFLTQYDIITLKMMLEDICEEVVNA